MSLTDKFIKRLFDLFISIAAISIFFLPSLLISVLIKLESRGPVFFNQMRVGKNGKDFLMY
ncbi:MAG: sugar transferase, partial [Candidatus Eremiobacterota bacterium]